MIRLYSVRSDGITAIKLRGRFGIKREISL